MTKPVYLKDQDTRIAGLERKVRFLERRSQIPEGHDPGGVAVALAVGDASINHSTWSALTPVVFDDHAISSDTYFDWNSGSGFLEILGDGVYQISTTFSPKFGSSMAAETTGVIETQILVKDAANASSYYGLWSVEAYPSLESYWNIDQSGELAYQTLKHSAVYSFDGLAGGEYPLRALLTLSTSLSGTHTAGYTMTIARLCDAFDDDEGLSNT